MAILRANIKATNSGLDRDRTDSWLSLVGGVLTNLGSDLSALVDCRHNHFRADRSNPSGEGRDGAVEKCTGDSLRTGSRECDAGQIDRPMRPTDGRCDEDVSDRDADYQLSVQKQQNGHACLQQDGRRRKRLGIFDDEGWYRSPEL